MTPQALPAAGARNLVVCCDGTNNTLTGGVEDTNVLLLYGYLRKHADPRWTVLYYDPGVGTPDAAPPTGLIDLLKRRADRIAGLASGRGVYENIGEAYRFLMQKWQPGDRIFCFGFSRGAFTARAVVGMVNLFGVLDPEHEPLIPTLVRIYFSQPPEGEQVHGRKNWRRAFGRRLHQGLSRPGKAGAEPVHSSAEATTVTRNVLADEVRRNFSRRAAVHWVGVWDTVESVGLPLVGSRDNPSTATFHDKPGIRNVRHALAFDEHRWAFLPRLYDAPSEVVTADGRTLKQLWFPGVHCDVGGSYPADQPGSLYPDQRTGLCDGALAWMINEAAGELGVPRLVTLPPAGQSIYDDLGMPRRQPFPAHRPLRHDALHDTPFWALAGMTLRETRDTRVLTNAQHAQAEAGRREGHLPPALGVMVDVKPHGPQHLHGPSVWDERRKGWPLAVAAIVAALAMTLSGFNLLAPDESQGKMPWRDAPGAACGFAMQQLATVSPWPVDIRRWWSDCAQAPAGGLRKDAVRDAYRARSWFWAMAWDFVFIAAFGYLIARFASRVFTWAAGFRTPGQPRPGWLLALGWLPAFAVGADALENTTTLASLGIENLGMPTLAHGLLYAVGVFSLAKLAGYALCALLFGVGRLLLAALPGGRVGQLGRHPSGTH
jgi:hypothetical protein